MSGWSSDGHASSQWQDASRTRGKRPEPAGVCGAGERSIRCNLRGFGTRLATATGASNGNTVTTIGPGMSFDGRTGGASSGIGNLLAAFAAMADGIDLDTALERVISAACQLVDAQHGALEVIGGDGMLSQMITVELEDDGTTRIVSLPQGRDMTSSFRVPIQIHGTVFGYLYLMEKNGGMDFSAADGQLLVALASAAGVAIENSRFFDESTRRTRWLEGGLNAARELLEQSEEEPGDLRLIARHGLHASQSDLTIVLSDLGHRRGLLCEAGDGVNAGAFIGQSGAGNAQLDALTAQSPPLLLTSDDIDRLLPEAPPSRISSALCTRLSGTGKRQFLLFGRSVGTPPFTGVDHEMVRSFTSHVTLSLELLRVHRQREQEAVFGDRDRIARDLHDLVIQRLFAAGLSVQSLGKYVSGREPLERIATVTAELDSAIRELRDTIYSLRSVPPISPTFTASISALVADVFDGHDLQPVIQLSGPLDAVVDPESAGHVRAVLLESLSNALRHSEARSITMTLQALADRLEVRITDDGRGFTPGGLRSGLANMQRRAALCKGTLAVSSSPGQGTEVLLTVPLVPA